MVDSLFFIKESLLTYSSIDQGVLDIVPVSLLPLSSVSVLRLGRLGWCFDWR
jgi:hypothetical protein